MSVATGLQPGTTSYQEVSSVLEEWRQETIPERDNLYGGTNGDNQAHLVVRAILLDLLFRDETVNNFIQSLVNSTPRVKYLQRLETVLDGQNPCQRTSTRDTTTICNNDLEDLPNCLHPLPAGDRYHLSIFLKNFTAFFEDDQFITKLVEDIWHFVTNLGSPYRWLVLESISVFIARCFIDGYSWTFQRNMEIEGNDKTTVLPEGKFLFEVLQGETASDGIARLRSEVSDFEEEITRFVENLPTGKVPSKNINSLTKYAEWLFKHKVSGRSIRSISSQAFPGEEDRRKDIYNGIKRAEYQLSLGS